VSRLTAADVQIYVNNATDEDRHIAAMVTGRNRVYAVDYNPRWSADWLCTCGHAPNCAHIRATKEAIGL
jgi:hypothetical protein